MYMVLFEKEWNGRNRIRFNPAVPGLYINRAAQDNRFYEEGKRYLIVASLTRISIGRYLPGIAQIKYKIKRVDRRLGN